MIAQILALIHFNEFKGYFQRGKSIFGKIWGLLSFLVSRIISYIIIGYLWNFFVYEQQYLLFDFINIQPNLYKPTTSFIQLFFDIGNNPMQQAILILCFLDWSTFWRIWIGKFWLFFLMFLNFMAFTILMYLGENSLTSNILQLKNSNPFEFYMWMVKLFLPVIIYRIRSMKDKNGDDGFSKDDHISILLDDGNASIIDLIIHANADIEKRKELLDKKDNAEEEEIGQEEFGDTITIEDEVKENEEEIEETPVKNEVKEEEISFDTNPVPTFHTANDNDELPKLEGQMTLEEEMRLDEIAEKKREEESSNE